MPGEGSCFWLEIPCPPVAALTTAALDAATTQADRDALRDLRLLVVDDDSANRELVRLAVEPFGVQVTEAEGGAEAVTAARSTAFDAILMDIRMPQIDGVAAAQLIRANPGRNVATPIVAFTAEAVAEMPPAWRGLFDALVRKPIVSGDLVALLAGLQPDSARRTA
jgi:CheY-like chemotaxis protein